MLAIACRKLNPNVREVVSRSDRTQEQSFFCEVSVEELACGLGLRSGGTSGLSVTSLPTLDIEKVSHEGGNLRRDTTYT